MAKLITVYWRDIPAQVIVKRQRESAKVMLSERFQKAIDSAAMRAGKGTTNAYLEEWRRVASTCDGDLQEAADAAAKRLEDAYDKDRLLALVRSKGKAPEVDV
jgi:hypothetical protein